MKQRDISAGTRDKRQIISVILNILILLFAVIGTAIMIAVNSEGEELTASGLKNLKYFTNLSNELCGIVSAVWLAAEATGRKLPAVIKLMAASAAGLTFFIVAAFLAPMYPDLNLYQNSNLWFHLILPLTAMAEFILLETDGRIPFRHTLFSALPALFYGLFYLVNILVNGKGEWPDTNDWYGFLNWGWGVGIVIFAAIVLMDFVMSVILRALNGLLNKGSRRSRDNG